MKNIKGWCVSIFCLVIFFSLQGCSIYNNGEAITKTSVFPKTIERAKKDNRYFVMYSGKDTFAVTNIMIENRRREFTVQLDRIDSLHRVSLKNPATSPEKKIFLHMLDSTSYTLDEPHTIPMTKVAIIRLIN